MPKPLEIKELESQLKVAFEEMELAQLWKEGYEQKTIRAGFALNEAGTIIGLLCHHIDVAKVNFPTMFPRLETLVVIDGNLNELSSLTPLTGLTQLRLENNQIQDLSPLASLTGLTQLGLENNQIQDLSPLASLTGLTQLVLENNQIQDLSPLVTLFRKRAHIQINGNPIESPPLEICDQGEGAILAWLDAPGQRHLLNEVRILLVGAGGVGKTSLAKALAGSPFDGEEAKTEGIRISSWSCPFQGREVRARLWDFGGQEIMHTTHQFFMSRRCLYLLVLDGRKEEGLVDYWFKLIESFGGDSPILVVLNKVDEHPNYDLNQTALMEKYPGIIGFFQVSAKTHRGLSELKTQIQDAFHIVKLITSIWPEPWLQVKEYLEASPKNYLDMDTFHEICRQHQVTEASHQKTLLAYLSDLGVALHFDDIALLNTQVLNPTWITEPVYRLLNHPLLAKTQGLLVIDQLRDLLPNFPVGQLNFLQELMSKFEICHPLAERRLIFPDLLPVSQPPLPELGAHPLTLRIAYDFLPRSILVRLMVRLHRFIKDRLQWRTGMVLQHQELESQAIIRVDYDQRRMFLQVAGADRKKFLDLILWHLREIHQSFEDIGWRELVPCRCSECLNSERPFEIENQNLIQLKKKNIPYFICMKSGEQVSVDKLLGDTYLLEMDSILDKPFAIASLELRGFRAASTLSFNLHPRLNVFAGVNGSGKTTLLEAAAILLSWLTQRIKSPQGSGRALSEEDLSVGKRICSLAMSSLLDKKPIEWSITMGSAKKNRLSQANALAKAIAARIHQGPTNVPVFVFYPVNRAVLDIPLRARKQHKFEVQSVYDEALVSGANFRSFFEWFRDREDLENDNRFYIDHPIKPEGFEFPDAQLEAVRRALSHLIPDLAKMRVRRKPKVRFVVEKQGKLLTLNQLSDGEKCLMALICDLARRLAIANPLRANPLEGYGVVLIDEIDLHLHPKWQRTVIPTLLEVFPNCQFLISTHSPQVLSHVHKESLFLLYQTDAGLILEKPNESYGKTSDRILEDLMGLSTTRPDRIQESLDDLDRLIDAGELDKARATIATLRAEIGEDPELIKAGVMIKLQDQMPR